MMRRTFIMTIALLCAVALGAWADNEPVTYISKWAPRYNGDDDVTTDTITTTTYEVLDANDAEKWQGIGKGWEGGTGYYVVRGNATYKTLNVRGEAHIILCDGATLTCTGGILLGNSETEIHVHSQSYGNNQGQLIVTNSYTAAGIGPAANEDMGTIVIHGGDLNVTGGDMCAGIGSGSRSPYKSSPKVVIYDGKVTATGGYQAAGIGGGNRSYVNVYIMGGTIDATGSKYAAAIGGGAYGLYNDDGSNTWISGGTVTAHGGEGGAGIGGGIYSNGGSIQIRGGDIWAYGGDEGAGIGGGDEAIYDTETNLMAHHGRITIGGNANIHEARGGTKAAGIGGGDNCTGGYIAISDNAYVVAWGGKYAAGIGGGEDAPGSNTQMTTFPQDNGIYISGNCYVEAHGGEYGAGIGGGDGDDGDGGYIRIDNGTVRAYAGMDAAGIGGGEGGNSGTIIINGGDVYADGRDWGAAIGAGEDANVDKIELNGGIIKAFGGGSSWAVGTHRSDKGDVTVAETMMVDAGDGPANIERRFTAGERVGACLWRKYAEVRPCQHETPTVGSDLTEARSYVLKENETEGHIMSCRYCGQVFEQPHDFVLDNGQMCVCGKLYNMNSDAWKIWVYYKEKPEDDYTQDNQYSFKLYHVVKGHSIDLPDDFPDLSDHIEYLGTAWYRPDQPDNEGLTSIAHIPGADADGSEVEVTLTNKNLLSHITPSEDRIYYACYRYKYDTEWIYDDDYRKVTLHIFCPDIPEDDPTREETLVIPFMDNSWMQYVNERKDLGNFRLTNSEEPTTEKDGTYEYKVTVNYFRVNDEGWKKNHKFEFENYTHRQVYYPVELKDMESNVLTCDQHSNANKRKVTLDGRRLYRDGSWNTLCLPFDVDVDNSVLKGAQVMTLASSEFDPSTGTLALNFVEAPTEQGDDASDGRLFIEAGLPYIIRWNDSVLEDLESPVFDGVILTNKRKDVETDYVDFVGTFSPLSLETNDRTVLYLGADNTLYYPNTDMTVGSCRAVFLLKDITAGDLPSAASARRFVLNFSDGEATAISITNFTNGTNSSDVWYTLDGRRLSGKPTQRGIYVKNGYKIIVK